MPPTTRASARRASGAPTPPRSTPLLISTTPQPQAHSSPLDSSPIDSVVSAAASSHPLSTATRASAPRASTASRPSLIANQSSTQDKETPLVGNTMSDKPVGPTEGLVPTRSSSDKDVDTSSHQILGDNIRQGNNAPLYHGQMSTTLNITTLEDITELSVRQQVVSLQKSHPWASVSLCHTMLVRCRIFVDANNAMQKMGDMQIPQPKVEQPGSEAQPTIKGEVSFASFSNDSSENHYTFDGSFSQQLNAPISTPSRYSLIALMAATRSAKKRGKNEQTTIESGQPLISFSKPGQSSRGVFTRAERRRAIAASTETVADRERASFIANAVLYRAFSVPSFSYNGRVSKTYSPYGYMISFPMALQPGPFPFSAEKYIPSPQTYRGTDRGKFQPLTFDTLDDGRVALQSICLTFPYLRTSFEELRFGDYIRGRKKAPHLFDIFRKLPAEVRCMIWQFAMPSRTVELRYNYSVTKCWTLEKVPPLLQVSRESRYEALKRYTLSFGLNQSPKIYFDFNRDALFFTYEKWHGDAEYEGEIRDLTHLLSQSGEAKKIRHLAIDSDLLEIFARILEIEEEEWLDEGDDTLPPPEIEAIPEYTSLQSIAIVKTTIDGFWTDEYLDCDCEEDEDEKRCDVHKRMKRNDKAVIVPSLTYHVNRTQQEYYKQMVAQVKLLNPDWNVPTIEYMVKQSLSRKVVARKPRRDCTCGECYSDSD